jgi:hypothetical protein
MEPSKGFHKSIVFGPDSSDTKQSKPEHEKDSEKP